MPTHVIVLDVIVAVVGFTIAAGPALVVTFMDIGKERATKEAAAHVALQADDVRELQHV